MVMTADNPIVRPWLVIARELAEQTDLERIRQLSHELNEALDKQMGEKWPDYLKAD